MARPVPIMLDLSLAARPAITARGKAVSDKRAARSADTDNASLVKQNSGRNVAVLSLLTIMTSLVRRLGQLAVWPIPEFLVALLCRISLLRRSARLAGMA